MHRKNADFLSANLFYFIACYALVVISVVVTFIGMAHSSFTRGFAVQMILIEVLAIAAPPLLFIFFPYWKDFLKNMRLGRINITILLILPIGVIGYFFISYVTAVWMILLTEIGLVPEAGATSVPAPETSILYGWSLLAIAVTPAVCEEFLFRGLIMPAYERHFRYPVAAILLSGVVFALMHGQFLSMPAHIILGIVLGYIVIVTESLWAGILLHFIQNAISMTILYFQEPLMRIFEQYHSENMAVAIAGAITGSANGAAGVLSAAEPFVLLGSILLVILFGAMYFGLLFLLYFLYKRRNGKGPFATRPVEPQFAEIQQQGSLNAATLYNNDVGIYSRPTKAKGDFLAWLPLLLTVPLILFEYASTFLMMVPGFAEWLQRITQNAGY